MRIVISISLKPLTWEAVIQEKFTLFLIYYDHLFWKQFSVNNVYYDIYKLDLNVWFEKKTSTWDLRRAVMNGKSNCFISFCSSFVIYIYSKSSEEIDHIYSTCVVWTTVRTLGHCLFSPLIFFWKELWWSRSQIKRLRLTCYFRSFLKLDSHWHFLFFWKVLNTHFENA